MVRTQHFVQERGTVGRRPENGFAVAVGDFAVWDCFFLLGVDNGRVQKVRGGLLIIPVSVFSLVSI